jgi:hypothetical protein
LRDTVLENLETGAITAVADLHDWEISYILGILKNVPPELRERLEIERIARDQRRNG